MQERLREGRPLDTDQEGAGDGIAAAHNMYLTMSPVQQSFNAFNKHDSIPTDDMIFSQDSFAPSVLARSMQQAYGLSRVPTNSSLQGSSQSSDPFLEVSLAREDIIVEKMHIHYGLKGDNPVSRLRFYQKTSVASGESQIARQLKESQYETVLPRVFEELAIRVFCRDPRKTKLLMKAFEKWCRDQLFPSPMMGMSQANDV